MVGLLGGYGIDTSVDLTQCHVLTERTRKDVVLTYSEHAFYSPILDCTAVRISMCDSHSREFFVILPDYGERGYSQRRFEALEILSEAIARGLEPGEVRTR